MAGDLGRKSRAIVGATLLLVAGIVAWFFLTKPGPWLDGTPAGEASRRAGAVAGAAAAPRAAVDVRPHLPAPDEAAFVENGVVLSGTLFDADGGPVPEATLHADWKRFELATDGPPLVVQFKADVNGKFRAQLRAGHYRLRVAADGYAASEYWLDLTASLHRNFTLQPAGSIAGRVVAGPRAEPVAGALVELMVTGAYRVRPEGGDPRAPAKVNEVLADAEGRFHLRGVSAGNYLLVARKGNLVGQRTEEVTVEPGNAIEDADITLSLGLFVQGRVTSENHVPITRAHVSLTAGGFNPRVVRSADTAEDGTFVIEGLVPGDYRLEARANGFGSLTKGLSLQRSSPGHVIVLPAETRVHGRLLTVGEQAVPSASITLWNAPVPKPGGEQRSTRTVLSDNKGAFVFDGLAPGHFWLEAADGQGIATIGPEPIVAGETRRVDLRFGAGLGISGQVKWKGGGPASDVLVRCKGTLLDRSARTDADGAYQCSGLVPDMYAVAAVRNLADEPWYLAASAFYVERYGGKRVELSAGRSAQGVQLELGRDDNSVSGVVVQPDGTPAANVAIYASREGFGASYRTFDSRAIDGRAVSLDDGTFQLDNLPDGPYQLRAQSIDAEGRQDNVPAGGRARIELQGTGALRGVVVERDGRPATNFTISVYLGGSGIGTTYDDAVARVEGPALAVRSVFDAAGRFEVAALRAGAYEVVARTMDNRSGRAAAVLTKGESGAAVRITLEGPGTLSGRVLDYDTGEPVAKCNVAVTFSEREVATVTAADGSFELSGPAPGEVVRLHFWAENYIDDRHTVQLRRSADIGAIKLIRGGWFGVKPRHLDWMLEGHVENTMVVAVRPGSQLEHGGVVSGAVLLRIGEKDASHLGPISVHYLGSKLGAALSMVMRLPNGRVLAVQP